ncbi:hypothetical protein LCGC14_2010020 [marine sediment metagenome]|uniref:Uncharacterized protein n=1 Tax=marine sediment metagenome TaxID=412755 RepID=A0A0F9HE00_9ZZZZ
MKIWLIGLFHYFLQLTVILGVVYLMSLFVSGYEFTNKNFYSLTLFYTLFRLTQLEVENNLK